MEYANAVNLGGELCDALGIDKQTTTAVTVHVEAGTLASVEAMHRLKLPDGVNFVEALKKYALVSYPSGPTPQEKYTALVDAISALYYAAHWTPDREVPDADALWAAVRDAAGLPPGQSPQGGAA